MSDAITFGKKNVKGYTDYRKYTEGKRLSYYHAILAKCWDCMGGYGDGICSCHIETCPLFPFMPYADKGDTKHGEECKAEEQEGAGETEGDKTPDEGGGINT